MHSSCLMKQSKDQKTQFPSLTPHHPTITLVRRKLVKEEETNPRTPCDLVINNVFIFIIIQKINVDLILKSGLYFERIAKANNV